jgi:nucleolar GTP-binding protein
MSFQDIRRIEKAQHYLDTALSRASKKRGKKVREVNLKVIKSREKDKIQVIKDNLCSKLAIIVKEFPSIDSLEEFYLELAKLTIDIDKTKQELSKIKGAGKTISDLSRQYTGKILKTNGEKELNMFKKQYLGRVSSVMGKIDKTLDYLNQIRKVFKQYPVIKTALYTVCISGFPNAGKSTLLGKITSSQPEVNSYAFTTKKMNLGYIEIEKEKIQVIDTPGTLARPEKMNNIERQAYLAIKYQADLIVYVFDLTEEYSIELQNQLLELIKGFRKDIIFYLSKTDIIEKQKIEDFKKEFPEKLITDKEELKEKIIQIAEKSDF